MMIASRSMGVLAGGANWGCYGPSLVPVLPQLPGGAQHPPAPPTLRPCGAKFHPHRCNDKGVRPQKLKFLLRFDRYVEYKCPTGAYPLRDFHKICRVCTSFQDAIGVKIWLDLLKGLWSYGGFKTRSSPNFIQIRSLPAEL